MTPPPETEYVPTDRPVVTRFAPSPTGALHIGGARTALFAWAFAKKHSGRFILRVEDTDLKRSSPESTKGILRDLAWLGLFSDEGPKYPCGKHGCGCGKAVDDAGYDPYDRDRQLGDNGPYFQSQRAADGIYDKYVQLLLDAGKAYEDDGAVRFRMDKTIAFTDAVFGNISVGQDDLEDFVIRKGEDGGKLPTFHFAVVVDDALMEVTHVIRGQEHLSNTTKHAALYDALAEVTGDADTWRRPVWVHTPSIMNPGGSKMSKRDKAKAVRNAIVHNPDAIDMNEAINFVKTEMFGSLIPIEESMPAQLDSSVNSKLMSRIQHKGNVPDDFAGSPVTAATDEYTRFIDGENDNAVMAYLLAMFIQENVPELDLKLPEIEVDDFRGAGYLQSALLNYIALLGWNPGDDIEHFDLDFLCEKFSLERIGKSNSTFDRTKLKDFNATAVRALDIDTFVSRMTKFVEAYRPIWAEASVFTDAAKWQAFCSAVQERTHVLPEPLEMNAFLIANDDAVAYDFTPKAIRKAMMGNDAQGVTLLEEMLTAFAQLPAEGFGAAAHEKINALAEASGINMGKFAQPVRIAVSGGPVTPPIDVTLELLGKEATLARMRRCVAAAKAHLETISQ
ncbi:glutamate--tRNA ligase family protein [Phycisphaeraceae bacterium D3-23]